jgi:RNA polymerase sigma factor (sigma-70 family)
MFNEWIFGYNCIYRYIRFSLSPMADYDGFTDEKLTRLLRQGDQKAFGCIYDRYWQITYQACYNRLRDRDKAKDIIQNIFTSLWDRRATVQISNLSAYLHTAVKFQVLRFAGQAKRTEFVASFEGLITEPIESSDLIAEREVLHLLRLFIDALPPKRRAIFIKRYYDNYTTTQIADELGISKKTVLNQLNNAETALRIRLAQIITLSAIAFYWLKN